MSLQIIAENERILNILPSYVEIASEAYMGPRADIYHLQRPARHLMGHVPCILN